MKRSLESVCNLRGLQKLFILHLLASCYLFHESACALCVDFYLHVDCLFTPVMAGLQNEANNGRNACNLKFIRTIKSLIIMFNLVCLFFFTLTLFCFFILFKVLPLRSITTDSRSGTRWDKSKRRVNKPLWNNMSQESFGSQTLLVPSEGSRQIH